MSRISVEEFRNFFKFYKGEEHQMKAVDELYRILGPLATDEEAHWIFLYRTPPVEAEKSKWAITKEQMAAIMGGSPETISDEIMNDYTRCVKTYKMDRLAQLYFLGQCGHESAGLRYPVEIHDGSNYEFRSDLENNKAGDLSLIHI